MASRRRLLAACIALALVGALLATCLLRRTRRAHVHVMFDAGPAINGRHPPRHFGAVRGEVLFVDSRDAAALTALVALLDERCGPFPQYSRLPNGQPAPEAFDVLHYAVPRPHPTETGRAALPLDSACGAPAFAEARSDCADEPEGSGCERLSSLPSPAPLDASWMPPAP